VFEGEQSAGALSWRWSVAMFSAEHALAPMSLLDWRSSVGVAIGYVSGESDGLSIEVRHGFVFLFCSFCGVCMEMSKNWD
jgi:hypothetical protein